MCRVPGRSAQKEQGTSGEKGCSGMFPSLGVGRKSQLKRLKSSVRERLVSVLVDTYRRTGADLPFGDPRRPHGVAMEGWFWRVTAPEQGVLVVALAGINRDRDGRAWGTVGLAAHPGGFSRAIAVDDAAAVDATGAIRIG